MLPEDPAGCAAADGCILALELVAEATREIRNGRVKAAHELWDKGEMSESWVLTGGEMGLQLTRAQCGKW